jgi:hypothetical protein
MLLFTHNIDEALKNNFVFNFITIPNVVLKNQGIINMFIWVYGDIAEGRKNTHKIRFEENVIKGIDQ